jgi:hypothetical protein
MGAVLRGPIAGVEAGAADEPELSDSGLAADVSQIFVTGLNTSVPVQVGGVSMISIPSQMEDLAHRTYATTRRSAREQLTNLYT